MNKSWKRFIIQVGVAIPFLFYSIVNRIMRITSYINRKNKKLRYVGQEVKLCSDVFYDKKMIFPIKKECCFEGRVLPVPNDSDAFLKECYGDYMVLPNPEDRYWHAKKIEC